MTWDPTAFSLADFYQPDGDDPLVPPADFTLWRQATTWASVLYEPVLAGPSTPVTLLRTGSTTHRVINLTAYGYLGIVRHPAVIAAAKAALDEYGTGACGSPMLAGKITPQIELEERLAAITRRPGVLIFNSGFGGALGAAAGTLRKGDVAVLDERAHVSLMDGARLSGARLVTFTHNQPEALDRVLGAHSGARRVVFVDGLYSMDGDVADLPRLLDVAASHRVGVVVDEAHSMFCFGASGGGLVEQFGVADRVGVHYGTFSKGLAAAGGFCATSVELADYLRCYANPYGFTCALPPATVAGLCAALDVVRDEPWRRQRLAENAAYFRAALQGLGIDTGRSSTHVVPLILGEDRRLLYEMGLDMRQRGLFLTPVDYPTAPLDEVRFRASITAAHSREELDEALQIIEDVMVPALRARGRLGVKAYAPVHE
jgi:7-keto-8-aminopelargonate synthetase-like enzyme